MRVLLIFFCISPVRKANKLLNYCFKKIQIQFKVSCNLLQICTFARTQGGPAGSSNTALNNTRPHPSHNTNLQLTHTHTHTDTYLSLSGAVSGAGGSASFSSSSGPVNSDQFRSPASLCWFLTFSHEPKVTWSFITKLSVDVLLPFQQIHVYLCKSMWSAEA